MSESQQAENQNNFEAILCKFKDCKDIFRSPVTLPCCGESICQSHIESLTLTNQENEKSMIKCCFCEEESDIPKKGFIVNKVIEQLLNINLGNEHKLAKDSIDLFESKLNVFDRVKSSSEDYIVNYFKAIIDNINEKRTTSVNVINSYYDGLLSIVEEHKSKCMDKIKKELPDISITELRERFQSWQVEIRKYRIDDQKWMKLNDEVLGYIEELDNKTENFKSDLLENKSFRVDSKLEEIDITRFGRVTVTEDKFSKNLKNNILISCSNDATIKSWNLRLVDGAYCENTFTGHSGAVYNIKFLDDQKLISCSFDKTIKVWDFNTGSLLKTYTFGNLVPVCLLKLSGTEFLSGAQNGDITLWDLNQDSFKSAFKGHTNLIFSLEMLSNDRLISCSGDKTIKIWDFKTTECLNTLTGHENAVTLFKLTSDNKLVSCSMDKTIKIWDLENLSCITTLVGHEKGIIALELFDNNILASGGFDHSIMIWDINAKICLYKITAHIDRVSSLRRLSSTELISSSDDKTIKIWNLNTFTCVKVLEGHTGGVLYLDLIEKQ